MRSSERQTSGEEVANAVTHVVGSHLGAAMLALLVWQGAVSGVDVAWKATSGAIFGVSAIFLYAISSAYHAVSYEPAKQVLHKMDHMAIFFLIAGSYTSFCLVTLRQTHSALAVGDGALDEAEGGRDGWSGDVGVEDGGLESALGRRHRQQLGDERLADAALAAHDGDNLADAALRVGGYLEALRIGAAAVLLLGAVSAVVLAFFAHNGGVLYQKRQGRGGA